MIVYHRLIIIHILCQFEMLDKFVLIKGRVYLCLKEAFYMEETINNNKNIGLKIYRYLLV